MSVLNIFKTKAQLTSGAMFERLQRAVFYKFNNFNGNALHIPKIAPFRRTIEANKAAPPLIFFPKPQLNILSASTCAPDLGPAEEVENNNCEVFCKKNSKRSFEWNAMCGIEMKRTKNSERKEHVQLQKNKRTEKRAASGRSSAMQ